MLSAIDTGDGITYAKSATYGPDSALTGFISSNSPTFAGITKPLNIPSIPAAGPKSPVLAVDIQRNSGIQSRVAQGCRRTGNDAGRRKIAVCDAEARENRDRSASRISNIEGIACRGIEGDLIRADKAGVASTDGRYRRNIAVRGCRRGVNRDAGRRSVAHDQPA